MGRKLMKKAGEITMNAQEIIKTVQSLPVSEQEKVLAALQGALQRKTEPSAQASEGDVEKFLLAEGIINEIPERFAGDEEETYEPIEIKGKPLSETILEDRN